MERGERKFVWLVACIIVLCVTILSTALLVALWQYRVLVAVSLLLMLLMGSFSLCVVIVRGNTPAPPPLPKQERTSIYG